METSFIFKSIQSDARDAVDLADEFSKAELPVKEVKLQLIQLLVHSTGIKDKIGENFIEDGDIIDLVEFVENKSKEVHESTIPLHNAKYFKRCVSFFERVFFLDWNTFTNSGNFKTCYFINLLEELSECEPMMMHVLCFAIRLKLVTAYLRGACVEDEQKSMPVVKAYAKIMIEKAIFYRSVQCPILACSELYEWIKIDDSFATDKNLRLIVWSLKMEKPKLICHALLIAYSLLRMEHFRDQFVLFVRKLVSIFEDLCFIENNSVFDWICRCCEPIYTYHRDAILSEFLDDLLDNLFAKSRSKAKSVAGFLINSVFDPYCHRKNVRMMLQFLQDKGQEHWRLLVDSIIDDYPVMLDFKLQVEMLMDDENVPEGIRLTIEEKEGLLKLMSYAVQESTDGRPPEYRAENMMTLNVTACLEYARKVTDALLPRFWDLFHLAYKNKERAQITLMSIAKSFHFAAIERTTMSTFVRECITIFSTSCQAFSCKVVMEFLHQIELNYRDTEVKHLCESVIATLKNYCESQLIELIDDFLNDPDKYTDSNAEAVKIVETVSIRVIALNRIMNLSGRCFLSRECSFESTRRLLEDEIQPRNRIFLRIMYVSVCVMCDHIIYATKTLKELCEEKQTRPEENDYIMYDIECTVKMLSIKLRDWNSWTDLSVSTFLNLCKVLETVRDLPLPEHTWNTLVPHNTRYFVIGFIAQMVWITNDVEEQIPKSTKTCILKAFLSLIEQRVLPLYYAYDVITNVRKERQVMVEPLREFIRRVCAVEEESIVVHWILNWMVCLFQISTETCLDAVGEFVELIYPIRKEMQNIICQVGMEGINLVSSNDTEELSNDRPVPRNEFLNVIVKLSDCLDDEKKLKQIAFKKDNIKLVKSFLKSSKKGPALRKVDKPVSTTKPAASQESILSSRRASQITPEESEPLWSPSSISRSDSVLADESDMGSLDSTDMPVFMVRSNEDNETTSLLKGGQIQAENMAHLYEDVSELVQKLRTTSSMSSQDDVISKNLPNASISDVNTSTERTKDENPSVSNEDDGMMKKITNSPIVDVDVIKEAAKRKSSSLSSGDCCITRDLANTLISDMDIVSQRQKAKNPSVSSEDGGITKGSANTSIKDIDFLENSTTTQNQIVKSPLPSTKAESTSQVYNDASKFVNSLNFTIPASDGISSKGSPVSISDENNHISGTLMNEPIGEVDFTNTSPTRPAKVLRSLIMLPQTKGSGTQSESTSQVYDNMAKFVEELNVAAVDDFVSGENSSLVVPNNDISNADLMESTPTKSSPRARGSNSSRAKSKSQMYDDARKFVRSLNSENSSASTSSNDDDFMKNRLNTSISDSDFFVTNSAEPSRMSDSPVYSPQTKQNDTVVRSTSQEYENMKNFLQNLNAENSSASASSGDDEVMRNLLNADLIDKSPLKSSPRANQNSLQDESTSQMYDNARKFVNSLNADNSSASPSSGDDDLMKKRLNTAISDIDSFAVSPIECNRISILSSSSPQANRSNTQSESKSQLYDNMRKFVKSLKAGDSSASISSGDDDLIQDLLNDSISETDLLNTIPERPTRDAIEDTQDLYNILASDGERQSDGSEGASKGVNDVAKNLQRVSLSNDESDETDSSSFSFGMPPIKKKRHS